MIATSSSTGLLVWAYRQERTMKFQQSMCNVYARGMTRWSDDTINKYMDHLRLMRWHQWRTSESNCIRKWLSVPVSPAIEEWRGWGKAQVRWTNQQSYTQKTQQKYQNESTFLVLPRNYTKVQPIPPAVSFSEAQGQSSRPKLVCLFCQISVKSNLRAMALSFGFELFKWHRKWDRL